MKWVANPNYWYTKDEIPPRYAHQHPIVANEIYEEVEICDEKLVNLLGYNEKFKSSQMVIRVDNKNTLAHKEYFDPYIGDLDG